MALSKRQFRELTRLVTSNKPSISMETIQELDGFFEMEMGGLKNGKFVSTYTDEMRRMLYNKVAGWTKLPQRKANIYHRDFRFDRVK
jgi:hypothetical protein